MTQARKFSPENERIKRRYFDFLAGPKRHSQATVDQVAAALADFEASTGFRDFRQFRIEQAQSYQRRLSNSTNEATGRPLAKATISARLAALKSFVQWLSMQPGFKSRITYSDAEYFNLTANDERIAKAVRDRPVPSIEQIRHLVGALPVRTDIERRNQALIAFVLLSGARDDAVASMSLKHVDLVRRTVSQHPREGVRTKNAKTMTTAFFPVGPDFEAIVSKWMTFLRQERLWGPDDPLFPACKVEVGDSGMFENGGLARRHWSDAAPIRQIFKDAFERAGLPYFNPHSFRKTLAQLGERICITPEAFKAWSQNLGHAQVLTTFTSYGSVASHRQRQILTELATAFEPPQAAPAADQLDRIERMLAKVAVGLETAEADD
jgi:integrase/recombinase XerC